VWAGEDGADLRTLTQDQTDALIRGELIRSAPAAERAALVRDNGEPREVAVLSGATADATAACHVQRGGMDSDPRARRAWEIATRGGSRCAVSAIRTAGSSRCWAVVAVTWQ
jgi:hypothetical protein